MYTQIIEALPGIVPELILLGAVCLMFLAGPFTTGSGLRHRWGALSLLALAVTGYWSLNSTIVGQGSGPFQSDGLVWFIRLLLVGIGAILVLILWNQIDDEHSAECHACLLAILAGASFTALANDLVVLFLGLELVSIPTYVLLYLPRRDGPSREATLKYFLLSIFSSAFVLYGMALLYGAAGTTDLSLVRSLLMLSPANDTTRAVVLIGTTLVIAGLGFRITAVPFHFYAPDVFQGIPAATAAMLSFIPKVVGFVALVRLVMPALMDAHNGRSSIDSAAVFAAPLIGGLAVMTMFVGNLMALRQSNLHRLMAYSSIAHAGYMMVGLALGETSTQSGKRALLFYLAIYGVMTIGFFAAISAFGKGKGLRTRDDLNGLSRRHPAGAFVLSLFLFSLIGLPPTGGFLGKFNLFLAAWTHSPFGRLLAGVMALNAAIGAWYYLRLISVMYLQSGEENETETPQLPTWIAACLCAVGTITLFIHPGLLWSLVERATGG